MPDPGPAANLAPDADPRAERGRSATVPATRGYIDVNAAFGPDHGTAATGGRPLAALVDERRDHGIRLSLASSLIATAHQATGNRLAAEAAADPGHGLAPVAVIGARRTGDAGRIVAAAEAAGAVGYRLQGWDGSTPPSTALGEVLDAVARTRRPLLVAIGRDGGASRIGEATASLGIPVILLGAHYNHIVDDLAAAVRFAHLHLETSALAHFRAVETAVNAIGAERILFGSDSPARAAASPIGAILAAAVPADAKRAILAGNAVRLFGLPSGPVDLRPDPGPARAFDVHAHFGPFDLDVPDVDDAALPGAIAIGSTSRVVASSAIAIFGDPVRGNAQAVAAAGHPDGALAYVVVDPADLETSRAQLRRHLSRSGVVGVKVHAEWSATPTASRSMADLFDLLAGFGRPVKIHNAGDGWDEALGAIARRHRTLPIIVAHGGLGTPSIEGARLAASHDNVHIEWSSSFAHLPTVRATLAVAGPDRLLWGSDGPLLEPAFVLGTYRDAGLPSEALDRVFWTNGEDLFR